MRRGIGVDPVARVRESERVEAGAVSCVGSGGELSVSVRVDLHGESVLAKVLWEKIDIGVRGITSGLLKKGKSGGGGAACDVVWKKCINYVFGFCD